MKIALVPQANDGVLPPRQNSIGLIMYNTAMELAPKADVTLFMKWRAENAEATGYPFGLERVRTPFDDWLTKVAVSYPRWATRLGITGIADRFPDYAARVASRLRHGAADVVHLMNYWSWCKSLADHSGRRRLVLEMQSEWLSQMDAAVVQHQLAYADAIVTVSDHIANLFRRAFPKFAGRVETVYNGVDIDVFRPLDAAEGDRQRSRPGRSILFVGRTSPEKGVHVLIAAFSEIAARYEDVCLDIVGPRTTLPARYLVSLSEDPVVRRLEAFYDGTIASDYQGYLNELVAKLGLEHRVRFYGSLPHAELVDLYRRASILCNPSFSESFGISIVEGMACGIPVIGTRIGGMLETIVDGEVGLLVEPDDPDALSAAFSAILEDSREALAMGVNGRERATRMFTWKARADRLLALYARVRGQ